MADKRAWNPADPAVQAAIAAYEAGEPRTMEIAQTLGVGQNMLIGFMHRAGIVYGGKGARRTPWAVTRRARKQQRSQEP